MKHHALADLERRRLVIQAEGENLHPRCGRKNGGPLYAGTANGAPKAL
jgi:hypothetical protein